MIPPLWIVNFCLIYTLNPELAALMPAYWTAIPQQVATDLINSSEGQINYSYYQQYFPAQSTDDEVYAPVNNSVSPSASADNSSFSNKIQSALLQSSATSRSAGDVATILGVSKSNLSKALKLAPAGIKSSNGTINISKLSKFLSKNSKAASILSGKPKGKTKKISTKRS
jgi:hypothetical protein